MGSVNKPFGDIITFTRASGGGRCNAQGQYEWMTTNAPRLDYDPVTLQARGLLIEEQRTNLCTNSEAIGASVGTKVTSNAAVAPDGLSTADLLIETTSTVEHYGQDFSFVPTGGVTYTWSWYVRDAGLGTRRAYIRVAGGGNSASAIFNIQTKQISTTTGAQAVSADFAEIGNGWFRIWLVWTAAAGSTTTVARVQLHTETTAVYTGDGTSGFYVWGRQLEAGAFPTSYIPTLASAVTRAQDRANVDTLAPWYNASEGTLVVDHTRFGTNDTTVAQLWDGSISNRIGFLSLAGADSVRITTSGSTQLEITATGGTGGKLALSYKTNDCAFAKNGMAPAFDNTVLIPAVNSLIIGRELGSLLNGHIRSIQYLPRRLTNAELQAITAV